MSQSLLYHSPPTRSTRVAWLIYEIIEQNPSLESEFEIKIIDAMKLDMKKPFYKKHNPFGKLPVLIEKDGEKNTIESGAIILYLAEKYSTQVDLIGSDKALLYQWMFFSVAEIDRLLWNIHTELFLKKVRKLGPTDEKVVENSKKELFENYDFIEKHLKNNQYLCGKQFTVADVCFGYCLIWSNFYIKLDSRHENLLKYFEELKKRNAYKKAFEKKSLNSKL